MIESGILKNKEIYNALFKDNRKEDLVYEPVVGLIIDIIKKNGYNRILDYGCGNGRFGFYFKEQLKEKRLFGADISEEALKICSDLYDEVYLTDGLNLPDKKFDFIVMNSVLEHVPLDRWDSLLGEVAKKLEDSGSIFVIIPNKNSPMRRFTKRWDNEDERLGHISLVDLRFLKNKLRQFGFINLKLSFMFMAKRLPDYLRCPDAVKKLIILPYSLLNIFPFYYLRDSFWILGKRGL
ncbi:MAG: class I SAM-dependent methyltransferase [Deltaproteobacteria bacterium]